MIAVAGAESDVRPAAVPAFDLPKELEASGPPESRGLARDEVRLLVSHRADDSVTHAGFRDLASFLRPGDLVVANDSATIPAALRAERDDGSVIDLHLSTRLSHNTWIVEPRKTQARSGERLVLPAGARARLIERYRDSQRLWLATMQTPVPVLEYLAAHGKPIQYPYAAREWRLDAYQTVYARHPGSAEMPSAGRPFSERVIDSLRANGVGWATLTLHCGVASLETHEAPYEEWFDVSVETAQAVNATRVAGGRVIAVGTTVVRALESVATSQGGVIPGSGWANLIVTPERGVRAIDGLLTGFHEPRASHLWMLEAIVGREHLRMAYEAALHEGYFWHEFGDVHLIL
ncbi:MAG: S-adenosylmethionine:tRNA ribosyltransferase-isomerase [Dehalococcoidia bacterium]